MTRRDYDMSSGKIRKKAPCFVLFCDGIDIGGHNDVSDYSIFPVQYDFVYFAKACQGSLMLS